MQHGEEKPIRQMSAEDATLVCCEGSHGHRAQWVQKKSRCSHLTIVTHLNKVLNHPVPLILALHCNFAIKACCCFASFLQNRGVSKSVLEK